MSTSFLQTFGFTSDPFASTNAADEPLIDQYFIAPPFFPAVIGDPKNPKSNVVFAPRGGGKTAQKIMIEKTAEKDSSFLCLSYDKFNTEGVPNSGKTDQSYHIRNLCRMVVIAYLIKIESDTSAINHLNENDRKFIVKMSREFLGGITAEKFQESLGSIKTYADKATDVWNQYGGIARGLINAIAAKFGFGALEIDEKQKLVEESVRFKFDTLVSLSVKLGFRSIYILVDRVDELPFTASDSDRAFEFLRPVLTDLHLLETANVAFKFFLWDQTREAYLTAGGRPDRLIEYALDWSPAELEKVLQRRLETYSDKKVSSFDQLIEDDNPYSVHKLIAHFSHSSPRDLIRLCKRIIDEHTRSGSYVGRIPFRTVKSAISNFSNERARELYGAQVSDLKKIGDLNFTIGAIANDFFRISHQAARSKVQKWQSSGAVAKIGEVPNPGNRPQYLYGVTDPRLAFAINSDATVEEALDTFLLICPHCDSLRIAFEGSITCPDCQGNFDAQTATTLGMRCRT